MSRLNDKKRIWIVSPIRKDDGEIRIVGYTRLRELLICCIPAMGYIDSQQFGDKVDRIYKFNDNKPIDIAIDGGDGIYFEKPIEDEQGLFQKPTLISLPLTHFGKQWSFNAEKKIY